MPLPESNISKLARDYYSIPIKERNSDKANEFLSRLRALVGTRLDEIDEKKKTLVYHMHELESLYESGTAGAEYYNNAHDGIQQRIHELEAEQKKLFKGMNDPSLLVEGRREVHLSRMHVIVVVELLLILTVVFIYYYITSR